MGWGDEIMALGRAEENFLRTGIAVGIVGRELQPRHCVLWEGNPAWNKDSQVTLIDGPGHRPYIKAWEGNRIVLNTEHRPRAGRVMTTDAEKEIARMEFGTRPFAVVSPHIKGDASPNKSWGADRWAAAIADFPLPVYQLGPYGTQIIQGAHYVCTPTMRLAAAAIERAAIVLTNEGGSHHLAASLGRPAVVVFGGFMDPRVTGYPQHANLIGDPMHVGCGKYDPCAACRRSLDNITPAMVKEAAQGQLHGRADA